MLKRQESICDALIKQAIIAAPQVVKDHIQPQDIPKQYHSGEITFHIDAKVVNQVEPVELLTDDIYDGEGSAYSYPTMLVESYIFTGIDQSTMEEMLSANQARGANNIVLDKSSSLDPNTKLTWNCNVRGMRFGMLSYNSESNTVTLRQDDSCGRLNLKQLSKLLAWLPTKQQGQFTLSAEAARIILCKKTTDIVALLNTVGIQSQVNLTEATQQQHYT